MKYTHTTYIHGMHHYYSEKINMMNLQPHTYIHRFWIILCSALLVFRKTPIKYTCIHSFIHAYIHLTYILNKNCMHYATITPEKNTCIYIDYIHDTYQNWDRFPRFEWWLTAFALRQWSLRFDPPHLCFVFHLICYSQILIRCDLKYTHTHTHTSSSILDIKNEREREREVAYRSSESARSSCTASNPPFSSSWDLLLRLTVTFLGISLLPLNSLYFVGGLAAPI